MPEFAVGVRRGTAFFKICLKNGFRLWQEKTVQMYGFIQHDNSALIS